MARIPEAELERLKHEVSVQHLVEARGVALTRHGKDFIGLCPLHNDTSPSLVISPEKNLWHCLGACKTGGSVIDWVMKSQRVSFRHAVEILREDPVLATTAPRARKMTTVRKLESPLAYDAEADDLLEQVTQYYYDRLSQNPDALAYLHKRGIDNPEMLTRFRVGFVDRTLGLRLPAKNGKAGNEVRTRLQQLGIVRPTGHELFRGCVTFALTNSAGRTVGMYGRKIDDAQRGSSEHLYLPGPRRGVFNLAEIGQHREVILCESIIDALSFWCAGYRNVTCAYGIEGFSDDLYAALTAGTTDRVLIAYDRDEAGDRGAEHTAAKLTASHDIACYRIQFPHNTDANEYWMEHGANEAATKKIGELIRRAQWLAGTPKAAAAESPPPTDDPDAMTETFDPQTGEVFSHDAIPQGSPLSLVAADSTTTTPTTATITATTQSLAPTADLPVELHGDDVVIHLGDRRWRIRGLNKNLSFEQLKINVMCHRQHSEGFHQDTFDMYSARHRGAFAKEAATALDVKEEVIKRDMGRLLLKLEELQEAHINKTLEPQNTAPVITDSEHEEALALLRDPQLTDRILADFERCGIVGEENNKLVAYIAAVSRKLESPLAVVIQSSTAAGKSSLMEAVLALMPEEERVKYSAMTGQSLFYMGETDLKHKILAIVEEEGAERAAYALKLLQSEGELTIASTGKDPHTGQLVTHTYRVEGPVMIFLTTTAVQIDEELQNRCLILAVNEEREQTRAIHKMQRQRETLQGLLQGRQRNKILKLHQNAQRLIRPLWVNNPFAEQLTFLDDRTRSRRDQKKYLTLIRTIALLYQYQRPVHHAEYDGEVLEYIDVEPRDIAIANRLMHVVLGRSLDELPAQTRRFLLALEGKVDEACAKLDISREDYRFTRRDILDVTGLSYEQVRVHIERLVELEYVLVHRGGRGQRMVYELLYHSGQDTHHRFCPGLLDVAQLQKAPLSADTTESLGTSNEAWGVFVAPLGRASANNNLKHADDLPQSLGVWGKSTSGVALGASSYRTVHHTADDNSETNSNDGELQ